MNELLYWTYKNVLRDTGWLLGFFLRKFLYKKGLTPFQTPPPFKTKTRFRQLLCTHNMYILQLFTKRSLKTIFYSNLKKNLGSAPAPLYCQKGLAKHAHKPFLKLWGQTDLRETIVPHSFRTKYRRIIKNYGNYKCVMIW